MLMRFDPFAEFDRMTRWQNAIRSTLAEAVTVSSCTWTFRVWIRTPST